MKKKLIIGLLACVLLLSRLTTLVLASGCIPACEGCQNCEEGVCVDRDYLCNPCHYCYMGTCMPYGDCGGGCPTCESCVSCWCQCTSPCCQDSDCEGVCCTCENCYCAKHDLDCSGCLVCVGTIFGDCSCIDNSTCELSFAYYVDGTSCLCQQIPPDTYPKCHGSGAVLYFYTCIGACFKATCDCEQILGTCGEVTVLIAATPICTDTGLWPLGPECDSNSDCTITSWTSVYGSVTNCCCVIGGA